MENQLHKEHREYILSKFGGYIQADAMIAEKNQEYFSVDESILLISTAILFAAEKYQVPFLHMIDIISQSIHADTVFQEIEHLLF